jgi:cation transport ATPase
MLDHLWRLSYDSKTIDILRNSKYGIPLIQSVHLLALTVLLGVTLVLNLRLLGFGMPEFHLTSLAKDLWRWATFALMTMVVSGFFVFLPDPARYAANRSFQVKMLVLMAAIVFQFTVFRKTVRSQAEPARSRRNIVVSCLSLSLWFGVGWAGRGIAFLG